MLPKALFLLPGTFLHELAHATMAMIFGKIESFSLWPSISGNQIVFGSVQAKTRYDILLLPIALAPLMWWIVLYHTLIAFDIFDTTSFEFDATVLLSPHGILVCFVGWQLLWAGKLSLQDIRVAISAIISISGLTMLVTLIALFYFFKNELFQFIHLLGFTK